MPDIPTNLIDLAEPNNGRFTVDLEHVDRLAREIDQVGLLHPIALEARDGRYAVIAGNCRLLAFRKLGRPTIPATILDTTPAAVAQLRLTENMTRSQLSPVEEAVNLGRLLGVSAGGTEALATRLSRSLDWIEDRLDILNYPEALRTALHSKTISLAAGKWLARICPPAALEHYLRQAILHGCTAHTARAWYQESTYEHNPNPPLPDFSSPEGPPTYKTTTEVLCFGCETYADMEGTLSVRFCQACLKQVNDAKAAAAANPSQPATPAAQPY